MPHQSASTSQAQARSNTGQLRQDCTRWYHGTIPDGLEVAADWQRWQASESRLYTFSGETKEHLRKFRLTTSRAREPQAVICACPRHGRWFDIWLTGLAGPDMIDKNTHEIRQDDKTVYRSLDEVGEDLPDHTLHFVLLSYPLTLPDGRMSVPYVLLYYLPTTCNAEVRMLYAGAKELMRNMSEAGRVIDIESAEDLDEIPGKLGVLGDGRRVSWQTLATRGEERSRLQGTRCFIRLATRSGHPAPAGPPPAAPPP